MKDICICLRIHQPLRLKRYRFFQMGNDHFYLDDNRNRSAMQRAVHSSYIPMIDMVERLSSKWGERFAVSISISGTALEQMREYSPLMIDRLRMLTRHRQIEWIAETHPHSFSSLFDRDEFAAQVENHRKLLRELLSVESDTFRNTDLIYTPTIGSWVSALGFKAMLIGAAPISRLYTNKLHPQTRLLPYTLWEGDGVIGSWIENSKESLFCTTIAGEEFVQGNVSEYERLFDRLIRIRGVSLTTPRVVASKPIAAEIIKVDSSEHILNQNELQQEAITQLYNLKERVEKTNNSNLTNAWRILQSVDNFEVMALDSAAENPYGTPYEAFINYMNVLGDFRQMLKIVR